MSSVNKRTILLILWLGILGGLYAAITHLSSIGAPDKPPTPLPPPLSTATLQTKWTQIVAHAAGPPRGSRRAAYTLAEFGDFQCPQCRKMRPVLERLVAQSGGKADLLFVPRPLTGIHQWAAASTEAGLAAAAQGKFWPMYDLLYAHQDDLEPGYYGDYAASAGLNVAAFNAAMAAHQYLPQEKQDIQFDDSLNVEVTPMVLLRDNVTGKITVYIGADSSLPGSAPGYQGILQLAAAPPWMSHAG